MNLFYDLLTRRRLNERKSVVKNKSSFNKYYQTIIWKLRMDVSVVFLLFSGFFSTLWNIEKESLNHILAMIMENIFIISGIKPNSDTTLILFDKQDKCRCGYFVSVAFYE